MGYGFCLLIIMILMTFGPTGLNSTMIPLKNMLLSIKKKTVRSNQLPWINVQIKKDQRSSSCTENIVAVALKTHGNAIDYKGI